MYTHLTNHLTNVRELAVRETSKTGAATVSRTPVFIIIPLIQLKEIFRNAFAPLLLYQEMQWPSI